MSSADARRAGPAGPALDRAQRAAATAPDCRNMQLGDLTWIPTTLERLDARIAEYGRSFVLAEPFPHVVMDGLFDRDVIDALLEEFPRVDDPIWDVSAERGIQVKLRTDWKSEEDVPPRVRDVVHFLDSGAFMRRLTQLTGVDQLISDPYFTGGGLNCILPGGVLDVHCDGNWHHAMGVHRRLNVILFLNEDWDDSWHGQFELWDRDMSECVKKISPIANRLLVFETHDFSYHGHPIPLACPSDRSRKSLILYYYTASPRPPDQVIDDQPHRALWRSRGLKPLGSTTS